MSAPPSGLLRFADVTVRLAVQLGKTDMPLKDVLALSESSVVPLDRLTDELLDLTANGRVVARGEVIAQDGRFSLRIVSLAGDEEAQATTSAADGEAQDNAPIAPEGARG